MSEESIRTLFAGDLFSREIGLRLMATAPITVALDISERHQNFAGSTHGGVVFSLADCALSLASNAAGVAAVAIDTHLALTSATTVGDTLTAVAEEVTRGRRLATYRIVVTRSDGRTCGTFTGTVFLDP